MSDDELRAAYAELRAERVPLLEQQVSDLQNELAHYLRGGTEVEYLTLKLKEAREDLNAWREAAHGCQDAHTKKNTEIYELKKRVQQLENPAGGGEVVK